MRLFIAVELSEELKSYLAEIQEGLRGEGIRARWVPPQNIHLTLKFLGKTEEERLEVVREACSRVAREEAPFSLRAGGVGCFPSPARARVIWVGIREGVEPLRRLNEGLEGDLEEAGFGREERSFTPHLTIARVRNRIDGKRMNRGMQREGARPFISMEVGSFSLIQSVLGREGALYRTLERFRLGVGNTEEGTW